MEPLRIEDPGDPRLEDYLGLTDVALRSRREPASGLYLAESEKVIRRALEAGHRPRSMLLSPRWLDPLRDLVDRFGQFRAPVFVGEPAVLRELTGFHVHRGAIASMCRPPAADPLDLLRHARRVVVLEDVVDHTNVGAVFRSAAGIGADAVLITPRCADPLYRRAVRVSMGTVFQVPWARIPWPEGVSLLQDHGMVVAALALGREAVDLDDVARSAPDRLALVLGTEGDGLSDAVIDAADLSVRIPMRAGVDSLNVAAAAAVALWAVRPV
jgi:tRNA G18 (ribose-2'-O)-methylase SpoU